MGERLFEETEQARLYQLNRIGYEGTGLEEQLLKFLSSKLQRSCAVDIGCGTGSLTRILSAHFTKVIGVDCSLAQLEEAKRATPQKNIEYSLGGAEDLPFIPNNTVELITVALSVHYFDTDRFLSEVDRILQPSGCLFLLVHTKPMEPVKVLPHTTSTDLIKKCDDLLTEILQLLFQTFDESTQQLILKEYPRPPGYILEKVFEVTGERTGNVDVLLGVIKSFGVFGKYCKMNPGKADVIDVYRRRFLELLSEISATPEEVKMTVSCPWKCLLYSKPETGSQLRNNENK